MYDKLVKLLNLGEGYIGVHIPLISYILENFCNKKGKVDPDIATRDS